MFLAVGLKSDDNGKISLILQTPKPPKYLTTLPSNRGTKNKNLLRMPNGIL
jgi:hypothetical protein